MYRTNVHRDVKLSKKARDYRAERLSEVNFEDEFWWKKYKMPWGKYKGQTFKNICDKHYQYIENLYIHLFRKPFYMAVAEAVKYHYKYLKEQKEKEAQWEQERQANERPTDEPTDEPTE